MRWFKLLKEYFNKECNKEVKILKELVEAQDILIAKISQGNFELNEIVEDQKLVIKDLKIEKFKHAISTIEELFDGQTLIPTQSNKPSAHSSLSKSEAMIKLNKMFFGNKWKIFTVTNTNSMEPFIDANSIIIGEKIGERVLKAQPITKGDICIYEGRVRGFKTLIMHRVKNIIGDKYLFLGDNNFTNDPWVTLNKIKYRYVGQIQTHQLEPGD